MIDADGWEKTERGWRKVYSAPSGPVAASDYPCPRVITDHMDAVQHVDGKFYESKSAFRAVTKREGYIEVGNDPARLRKPERPKPTKAERDKAIKTAIEKVIGV